MAVKGTYIDVVPMVTFQWLFEITKGFSEQHIICSSKYGEVYKVYMISVFAPFPSNDAMDQPQTRGPIIQSITILINILAGNTAQRGIDCCEHALWHATS